MRVRRDEGAAVQNAVEAAFRGRSRVVLAISGGLDSMVLLDAAASLRSQPSASLLVATFDHGTGPHAHEAVRLVQKRCASLGIPCTLGRAMLRQSRESEWRDERWRFLRATAVSFDGAVATAHTLDDHIETVFMRILRDAGPRGLAGLLADSDVLRPLLHLSRADLENYARSNGVRFVDDPSNKSRSHLRNRVRHDLLPAMTRTRPSFPADLMSISRAAACWRESMHSTAESIGADVEADGSLRIARSALAGYDAESLRALWPALAAKVGVVMDRRGTHRLAEFTMNGRTGGAIQLSGGVEVRMTRAHLLLQRWDAHRVEMIRSARLGLGIPRIFRQAELT